MVKDKVALATMLGNYPNTEALKSGKLHSDLIDFDFADVKVANNFFKQIVRDAKIRCRRASRQDVPSGQVF